MQKANNPSGKSGPTGELCSEYGFTVGQVAKAMQTDPKTVRRWCERKREALIIFLRGMKHV